ncbi:hypothetical protein [Dyadobacter sp. CY356]|uniref:hypothetical protein n=1 Tax=Dyadobacter sp. CY356 TaxID=2906442 RepID=UPI001F404591|nr:hypothetical protein [Dyadobacter sp. CY356]MCF0059407.1 hypothetical protein [Dyadobacter sp. CY356]
MAKIIKKRDLTKEDIERLELLQKAEEVKGEQLQLDLSEGVRIENEAERLIGQKIDDPVAKFQLYYKGLNNLLRENLPSGKDNELVRRVIYDEKNILINRGAKKDEKGIRGSDGRMAYLEDLELAIQVVAQWLSRRGTYQDLYLAFWDKNEELNYGHQD